MPRMNTPASSAEETEAGRRKPVSERPKGEGMLREVSSVEPVRGAEPKSS